jgi:hypothetical protein
MSSFATTFFFPLNLPGVDTSKRISFGPGSFPGCDLELLPSAFRFDVFFDMRKSPKVMMVKMVKKLKEVKDDEDAKGEEMSTATLIDVTETPQEEIRTPSKTMKR